jgi:hypothetical protein
MGVKSRKKRERREFANEVVRMAKRREEQKWDLVRLTVNLPFAPAGVYYCDGLDQPYITLKTGDFWCGVGNIYKEYVEPIPEGEEATLNNQYMCYHHAKRTISFLNSLHPKLE